MPEVVGVHLLQPLPLVASRRRSAVARVDASGRLSALDLAAGDEELVETIGSGASVLVVDAPLAVPGETGRRDVERILAWCDVPAFPVAAGRLRALHGGMRGVELRPRLAVAADRLYETLPGLVLRQVAWERGRPAGAPPLDLAEYRTAWLGVRAPVYGGKPGGAVRLAGLLPAWRLLDQVLDLGGWVPADRPDAEQAADDAARLDALCCAYAARRMTGGGGGMSIGTPSLGQLALPVDACLRHRVEVTLERLRAEGSIRV